MVGAATSRTSIRGFSLMQQHSCARGHCLDVRALPSFTTALELREEGGVITQINSICLTLLIFVSFTNLSSSLKEDHSILT